MATHSSTLAWKMPWTAEPGGLPSMGSLRVGHNWSDLAAAAAVTLVLHRETKAQKQLVPALQVLVDWLETIFLPFWKKRSVLLCRGSTWHLFPTLPRVSSIWDYYYLWIYSKIVIKQVPCVKRGRPRVHKWRRQQNSLSSWNLYSTDSK